VIYIPFEIKAEDRIRKAVTLHSLLPSLPCLTYQRWYFTTRSHACHRWDW